MEYITEKQCIENGPLLIDIDMKYSVEIKERQHTQDHIIDLIMLYAAKILEIYNIQEEINIPVYVMQKNRC